MIKWPWTKTETPKVKAPQEETTEDLLLLVGGNFQEYVHVITMRIMVMQWHNAPGQLDQLEKLVDRSHVCAVERNGTLFMINRSCNTATIIPIGHYVCVHENGYVVTQSEIPPGWRRA